MSCFLQRSRTARTDNEVFILTSCVGDSRIEAAFFRWRVGGKVNARF